MSAREAGFAAVCAVEEGARGLCYDEQGSAEFAYGAVLGLYYLGVVSPLSEAQQAPSGLPAGAW